MVKRILFFPVYVVGVLIIFTAGFIQGARYELRRFRRARRR